MNGPLALPLLQAVGENGQGGCMKTTVPVRLYPTPDQAALLRARCQEYISTINVLVQALDSDVLPEGAQATSTKDFIAALPSAVKNQVLRDARSVWTRSIELGVIPILRKPICQWNNQNWRIERGDHGDTLRISSRRAKTDR
jgi:hypothetical protein